MTRLLWVLYFLCLATWTSTSAKRVIFMPYPSTSCSLIYLTLARSLAKKGHDITFVLLEQIVKRDVLNFTGMSVIEYNTTFSFEHDIVSEWLEQFFHDRGIKDSTNGKFMSMTKDILGSKSLYQDMKTLQPDLFVLDNSLQLSNMFAVFPYKLGIPFACIDCFFQGLNRRIPFSPATVPSDKSGRDHKMNLFQRLQNAIRVVYEQFYRPLLLEDVVARYAPEKPYISLSRLSTMAEIWLVETDPILRFPYPALPNTKYIGGIMAMPSEPLDSQFQVFMDGATEGVIVVSFGSMILNLPENIANKLMSAFLQLSPMKVVLRSRMTSPDPSQIMTSSWLPQNSLLAHPNTKVLVSHGGLTSHYQALYHGVPMLDLPFVNDQFQNANAIQRKGFGLFRDIRKITADDLAAAVQELVQNSTYTSTIRQASELYRELYPSPRDTAAYWLDHVMKHGGGYMRSAGQDMPLYQFLLLDVLMILGSCVLAGLALLWGCLCLGCRYRWGRKQKRE